MTQKHEECAWEVYYNMALSALIMRGENAEDATNEAAKIAELSVEKLFEHVGEHRPRLRAVSQEESMNGDDWVPVPVGDYDCEIIKIDYAQNTLKVRFKTEAAYNSENIENGVGRYVFDTWSFTQSGRFKPDSFVTASGVQIPVTINKVVLKEWAASLIGLKIGVRTDHRNWRGEIRSEIQKYMPYQGGTIAESGTT